MINITIEKKDLWIFSAIIVFLIGAVYVIAIGEDYLVHGHDQNEINLPTCGANQVLKYVGGSWSCQNDNAGGGSLDCTVSTDSNAGDTETVSCPGSREVTGGGCNCGTLAEDSRPSGNGWRCDCVTGGGGVTAYAVCCNIA